MVCSHPVKPRREWPGGVILADFLTHLHEDLSCGVLSILTRWQGPPAEPENRRGVLAVKIAPGVRIPLADSGQQGR